MTPPVDDISRVVGAVGVTVCVVGVRTIDWVDTGSAVIVADDTDCDVEDCAIGNGLFVDMISTSCMVQLLPPTPTLPPALMIAFRSPMPPSPLFPVLTLNMVAGCNGVNVIDGIGDVERGLLGCRCCCTTLISIGDATMDRKYSLMSIH